MSPTGHPKSGLRPSARKRQKRSLEEKSALSSMFDKRTIGVAPVTTSGYMVHLSPRALLGVLGARQITCTVSSGEVICDGPVSMRERWLLMSHRDALVQLLATT